MNSITTDELLVVMHTGVAPVVVDVRRVGAFEQAERVIATACWRDHALAGDWATALAGREAVVYCVHGQQVSQAAVALLRSSAVDARYLVGGFDAWENAGGATVLRREVAAHQGRHWVTRDNPQVGHLACAWLIRRFIDPAAVFHFVDADWVREIAVEIGAVVLADDDADDDAGDDDLGDFDAVVTHFGIVGVIINNRPALSTMADIIRDAAAMESVMDTTTKPTTKPAAQSSGLAALSHGLSALYADASLRLAQAMIGYDALYRWCRDEAAQSSPPRTKRAE